MRGWRDDGHQPAYIGDALTDLHDGRGTTWRRDGAGDLYPDCCDKHRPKAIRATTPADTTPSRPSRPGRVVSPHSAPVEPPAELDDETALRLLATWLRRLATRSPKGPDK